MLLCIRLPPMQSQDFSMQRQATASLRLVSLLELTLAHHFSFVNVGKINGGILDYFRSKGYKNPTNKDDSIFQHAVGTEKHYFDWVFQPGNDEEAAGFLNHMKLKTLGPKWYDLVPVDKVLGTDLKPDDVLLVDVGGNTG
jgi:hypothetical protein